MMSCLLTLKSIERQYKVVHDSGLSNLVNFSGSYKRPTHRWFRYREGFSPGLLEHLKVGERLYDPFCGCGTALIEASSLGINSIGTDVNPLAVFIAKVKTTKYTKKDALEFAVWSEQILNESSVSHAEMPDMDLLHKLFQTDALKELLRIKGVINTCQSKKTKSLLEICWLNILEPCSNIYKEGNGLKYRNKKRLPGKYETIPDEIWIPKYFGNDIIAFIRNQWSVQSQFVIEDLQTQILKPNSKCEIVEKSCIDLDIPKIAGDCDTALFSPPYANRFDYFEAFKMELWMGGFVKSQPDIRTLRNNSIRNNLTVRKPDYETFSNLESLLEQMDEKASSVRMGIKNTLRGYFTDMYRLGLNLKQVLHANKGNVYCVIGNSAYANVIVPTDLLVGEAFERAGLKINQIKVARHLTVSSQQRNILSDKTLPFMRESVICASA